MLGTLAIVICMDPQIDLGPRLAFHDSEDECGESNALEPEIAGDLVAVPQDGN